MVRTVSGSDNNNFKFNNKVNGPLGNYGGIIRNGTSSDLTKFNKKITEEYNFDNFLNDNNFTSTNNGVNTGINGSTIIYNEDDWLNLFRKQVEDKEAERKQLNDKWFLFTQSSSTYYSDLYYDDYGKCLSPEEYRANSFAIEKFLNANGYSTNEFKNYESYSKGIKAFEKYIEEVYAPNFNKHFNEYVGLSYDEFLSEISRLDNDIAIYKASIYSVEQQKKLKPYVELIGTESYKQFVNNNNIENLEKKFNELNLSVHYELSFLVPEDAMIYYYLYEKQGYEAADKFIKANEDKINQAKGKQEAELYLASITKDNGEIDYNLLTSAITAGKGIFDGIESFGEGVANIFAKEAMISSNQYAQMYILERLSNPGKFYLDNIIDELARVESFRTGSSINSIKEGYEFYSSDGSINLKYAKSKLTDEQYKKLESMDKFKSAGYEDIYQISSSIGNMLPSIAISTVMSILATPAVGSLFGNVAMGVSAAGNAKMSALVSGNDMFSSTLYGLMSGLSETSLGLLLGNIPGLNESAKFAIKGFVSEGTEELLQTFVDAGLRASILGQDIDISELFGEGGKSFIYGMITSAIMNGGRLACNIVFNSEKANITSVEDLANFISILNSEDMSIMKVKGKDAIIFNNDADIDSETINKIKQIFPNAEIHQVDSKSGTIVNIIGTEMFNRFIIENLHESPSFICDILKKLNSNTVNTIFNDVAVKEYINSLTIDELKKIFVEFKKSNLSLNVFKTIILNMTTEQLILYITSHNDDMNIIRDCVNSLSNEQLISLLQNLKFSSVDIYKNIVNSMSLNQFIYALSNRELMRTLAINAKNSRTFILKPEFLFDIIINEENSNQFINSLYNNYEYSVQYSNYDILKGFKELFNAIDKEGYVLNFTASQKQFVDYVTSNDVLYRFGTRKLSQFFSSVSSLPNSNFYVTNNFGVDQAAIERLCSYKYQSRTYVYHKMMNLIRNCKEQGNKMPCFTPVPSIKYNKLLEKLQNKGFNRNEARIILESVNDAGACSYASVCNIIFSIFENCPSLFEEKFGFPMYMDNDSGLKRLNSIELLLDLYLFVNDTKNGGKFITDGHLNSDYLNGRIDYTGNPILSAVNQAYLATSKGHNDLLVNYYLTCKGIDIIYSSSVYMQNRSGKCLNADYFYSDVAKIVDHIYNGNTVTLDIFKRNSEIRLISTHSELYQNQSTRNWKEGDGHSVFVTGVVGDGFVVSSWGNQYIIPFSDLINGGDFIVNLIYAKLLDS